MGHLGTGDEGDDERGGPDMPAYFAGHLRDLVGKDGNDEDVGSLHIFSEVRGSS